MGKHIKEKEDKIIYHFYPIRKEYFSLFLNKVFQILNIPFWKSCLTPLAQPKLEQAKRRQRRHSSIVSTDLDKWNNSDTVEVINLVSDSPQQSPITIVTSSSPKDFMGTSNKGRGSV